MCCHLLCVICAQLCLGQDPYESLFSEFQDIFDVDHFITSLRDQVRILKELSPRLKRRVELGMFYSMPPISWSDISYYLHQIIPLIQKFKIVHLNKTDARLANNGIIITAFVGMAIAFGCFSAAAMLAKRREYLYLGDLLSSGFSILFWLYFASSIFGGSAATFKFEVRVAEVICSIVIIHIKATFATTSYGCRPDFGEIFDSVCESWGHVDVGVIVCGPQSIESSVC
ncbi:hypothetical protein GIB67_005663 [Kingdonia uniflora]|uniref:O-fucosyltransferase family protein n=1 Tax=Kingdonia uniflora TaxID=39325 RepID=A0A7J7NI01_9MAGN|nr:hypothetical protein GIB67_005663 [Kingdonia uniflora]